jgi:DNA polymerase
MDERQLRELELLPVARLYGMEDRRPRRDAALAPKTAGASAVVTGGGELRLLAIALRDAKAASVLLVGPGSEGDADGEGDPFTAQPGKLLDNMLAAIGARRVGEPRHGRADEVERSAPALVVALGAAATRRLLGGDDGVAERRGTLHRYRDLPVVVTHHPRHLMESCGDKAEAWEDLLLACRTLAARG